MSISYQVGVRVVDSHTGGEPTRVVIDGGPDLGSGPLVDRRKRFQEQHDDFRSAVVNEPRGSDVLVGALLVPPTDSSCVAGVVFFNNVGYLGMCGHGTMGVAVTLAHLGRITPGSHRLETPIGIISFELHDSNTVTIENVPSYRLSQSVAVTVDGTGTLYGDVAWGGNWFYLVSDHSQALSLSNVEQLTAYTWKIRTALTSQGITGHNGEEIDHIELFGPPGSNHADSKNFVLCPGKAYDRSPCGTGTSAKLACLYADGKLKEGVVWRQESITGSVFEGTIRIDGDDLIPRLTGTAYICAESTLIFESNDPLRTGIRS
ncbi:MAG: proline racemase family protein [Gemmataceae bacterium]